MLHKLKRRKNRKMPKKRLGRGYGSNSGGHTVGRGQKGQLSRSGHKSMIFFEGGNVPLYKRLPKFRGFKRVGKDKHKAVNVSDLEQVFKDGDKVTLKILKEKTLVHKDVKSTKILGYGDLTKKLTIEGIPVSETAREKILASKGTIK
ncbi:50S ribosomal protein L15 [Candidatus Dojkabacteria bacterium]|nr:50S ribosomal protein L15 [Candidatus Dojkabacteria bacterium]